MSDYKNGLVPSSSLPSTAFETIRTLAKGSSMEFGMERTYDETPSIKTGVSFGKAFLGVEYGGKRVQERCWYSIKKL